MSAYNLNISLETIKNITVMFLDIFIIWLIIYYALRIIRNNARTIQIFKGIMVIIVIDGLAKVLGLKTVQYLADRGELDLEVNPMGRMTLAKSCAVANSYDMNIEPDDIQVSDTVTVEWEIEG